MTDLQYPHVTVIMPVRDEGGFIRRSLGSVLRQDYPSDRMDVIVADGGSKDGTAEVVAELAAADPRVMLVANPRGIVSTGLNAAIALARGEIIVRVDGHCEIASDYVRRSVDHLRQGDVEGVGGPLDTVGETPVARSIALAMSSSFGVGNSAFRTVKGHTRIVDTVAFPAYTRIALATVGPFDTELVRNQDDEYNYRLRKLGGRLLLAGDVRSRYYSRGTFRRLWRQYFQYGWWKVRVFQKHPAQMSLRQFVPAAFVLAVVGSPLVWWPYGSFISLVVLAAYASANLVATAHVARREAGVNRLQVFAAFFVLHVAYGLGFLSGLVRFAHRWFEPRTERRRFDAHPSSS